MLNARAFFMHENILHLLWKTQRISNKHFDSNLDIEIINRGNYNSNQGADFLNASLKIEENIWYGNIEFHINSSDWNKHNHQNDPKYNNVILHLVLNDDTQVFNEANSPILTVPLKDIIRKDINLIEHYMKQSFSNVSCLPMANDIPYLYWLSLIEKKGIDRLELKCKKILSRLKENNYDWDKLLLSLISRYLGSKINNDAFEQLAQILRPSIIYKYQDQIFVLEAMLFGQAGLLPENSNNDYTFHLINEYKHLKKKHQLHQMSGNEWLLFRLHPNSFPHRRISQFASILSEFQKLKTHLLELNDPKSIKLEFTQHHSSWFWTIHTHFSKECQSTNAYIGSQVANSIIINAIIPFIKTYGIATNNESLEIKAEELLQSIPVENNRITRNYTQNGISLNNAFESQGAIQLFESDCSKKKCVNCSILTKLLSKKESVHYSK